LERVERLVNQAVAADMLVTPKTKSRQQAIAEGAMALFGEKYGETVRTITITPESNVPESNAPESNVSDVGNRYSYELCGGTHLDRTGNIGAFIILNESSAAAGVRRIEAVTGRGAYELIARRFKLLKQAASAFKSAVEEVPQKAGQVQDELAVTKKQIAVLKIELALSTFNVQLANVSTVHGVNLLALELPNADKDTLGKLADRFREKYPQNGVCVIAAVSDGQVVVMAAVTQDLIKKGIKAGDLVGHISRQLGAGGGGAPHLAFGGGRDASKLPEALESVRAWVEGKIN
jgi:alanyl-tRNA synthetase